MPEQQSGECLSEEFTAALGEYGVDVRRVAPGDVQSAIATVVEPPAVGTELPWDDVSVPESVTTDPTVTELEAAVTGVTAATLAIAEYGSLVLGADSAGTEPISLFNDLHVVVVRESDIVPDMEAAFEWFENRDAIPPADPDRKVVLYPDVYTNYVLVDRGKAAVRALEALGVEVVVVPAPGSGRAPLSQGMIETARTKARAVADELGPYLEAGYDIVVVEPSDLAMFRGEYGRLLPEAESDRFAEHSYEILEYVYGLLANGADAEVLDGQGGDRGANPVADRTVAYHSHCQQRTLELAEYSVAVLAECGYEVTTTDVECCGMAGSFGYKEQYYELSMDVGANLASQLREIDADHVVASGTSCTDQIGDLLGEEPLHVIELVAPPATEETDTA